MLTRWNPWGDLFDLQHEMQEFLRQSPGTWRNPTTGAWFPAIDVFPRGGDLVVRAELPGIDPDKDVSITVQDGYLVLAGERQAERESNGESYYRAESSYGSFRRTVALPDGVDADDVKASYKDGILEVVVPRAVELEAPKRIPITTGEHRKALEAEGQKK